MASILNVDQINNAAGTSALTIDTSGNVNIPGHVVQVVSVDTTSQVAITSGYATFTTIITGSITPKFSGSKFIISAVLPNYSNNPSAALWTNSIYIRLYEQEGGGSDLSIAQYEHPGPQTSMEFSQAIPVLFTTGAKSTIQSYTYRIKGAPTVAGDTHYFGRSSFFSRMVIMEISQ